jgi:hypothetical protein
MRGFKRMRTDDCAERRQEREELEKKRSGSSKKGRRSVRKVTQLMLQVHERGVRYEKQGCGLRSRSKRLRTFEKKLEEQAEEPRKAHATYGLAPVCTHTIRPSV